MRGTVVELCGLPGAGKSALAAQLVPALRARGLPARAPRAVVDPGVAASLRLRRKLLLVAGHAAAAPRQVAAAGRLLQASAQADATDALTRWVQWVVTQRLVARGTTGGSVDVLDEGVVQALWSIGLRGDVTALLDALAAGRLRWSAPRVVLFVEVVPAVAARRLESRPSRHSRVQQVAAGGRLAELERGRDLLERVADWWQDSVPDSELWRVPAWWEAADVDLLARRIAGLGDR